MQHNCTFYTKRNFELITSHGFQISIIPFLERRAKCLSAALLLWSACLSSVIVCKDVSSSSLWASVENLVALQPWTTENCNNCARQSPSHASIIEEINSMIHNAKSKFQGLCVTFVVVGHKKVVSYNLSVSLLITKRVQDLNGMIQWDCTFMSKNLLESP